MTCYGISTSTTNTLITYSFGKSTVSYLRIKIMYFNNPTTPYVGTFTVHILGYVNNG